MARTYNPDCADCRREKPKAVKAWALASQGVIDLTSLEPRTPEGRKAVVRTINRPAGDKCVPVIVKVQE